MSTIINQTNNNTTDKSVYSIDKNMKKLSKIFFTLTIVWMIVIFIFSSQTGDMSANLSGGITEAIVKFLVPDFKSFSPEKQLEILDIAHLIIRKGAHFTEYAILGIFSILTLLTHLCASKGQSITKNLKKHLSLNIMFSFIFSMLYAISDEIHQGFTEDRYPSPFDVMIDSSGALCGILFTVLMFYLFHIKKAQKEHN